VNSPQSLTPSTEAVIAVSPSALDAYGGASATAGVQGLAAGSTARAIFPPGSTPPTLVNTVGFSYSSDVLQLGDPFSVSVPNPRGLYTDKFLRGQTVQLFLRNPNVQGNALTLKHLGIIVRRRQSVSSAGSVIHLDCADLGWHLVNNDAPLWEVLQYAKLETLVSSPEWVDPSWGIRGLRADNTTNRLLRQNVNNGRAQANIDLFQALGTLVYIQAEPGDKVASILAEYARKVNRLVNVSCDGYLQVWQPDYERTVEPDGSERPNFRIELHDIDDPARNRNGVLDCFIEEDITSIFTNVACIGEMVGGDLALDPANQNATKRRADFANPFALPFAHRIYFADGDIFDYPEARAQALWRYNRGIFDSWQAVYVVRGHWQRSQSGSRAFWWESDQMCTVEDSVNGLSGSFYIASVRCDRDENGDRTTVTLRKPCLQASFGQYKRPPRILGSIVDTYGATTSTQTSTTVVRAG
jgi:hypothetical protein